MEFECGCTDRGGEFGLGCVVGTARLMGICKSRKFFALTSLVETRNPFSFSSVDVSSFCEQHFPLPTMAVPVEIGGGIQMRLGGRVERKEIV